MTATGVNVNQQSASYIIGKDDTTYYAIRASDGVVAYSGTEPGAVINSAATALASGTGGTIHITKGTYTFTTGINLPARVNLVGEGMYATHLVAGAAITLVTLSSAVDGYESQLTIKDLELDGNTSTGVEGIYSSRKYVVTLENLQIRNFSSMGIDARDSVIWKLKRVRLRNNGDWGMKIISSATVPSTINCEEVMAVSNVTGGVYTEAHGSTFTNCDFESTPIGIEMTSVTGASIRDSWFEGTTDKGIYLKGNITNQLIDINRCLFSPPSGTGIYLDGTNYNVEIHPCVFENCASLEIIHAEQYAILTIYPQMLTGSSVGTIHDKNSWWHASKNVNGFWWSPDIMFYDDFVGAALDAKWNATTGTWGMSNDFSGWVRGYTAATTSSSAIMNWNGMRPFALAKLPRFRSRFRLVASAANQDVYIGITNGGISNSNHGVWLESLAADTNWFTVTCGGSAKTRTDTGLPRNLTAHTVEFEIYYDSAYKARFFIDGILLATHTTNIPTSTTALEVWVQTTTEEMVTHYIELDDIRVHWSRS